VGEFAFFFGVRDVAVTIIEVAGFHGFDFYACKRCCVFAFCRRCARRGECAERKRAEQREANNGSPSNHLDSPYVVFPSKICAEKAHIAPRLPPFWQTVKVFDAMFSISGNRFQSQMPPI
jgi:hypothetical protein